MLSQPQMPAEPVPCLINCLPAEHGEATIEAWKAYAVTASERYRYAYTLVELMEGGLVLVQTCAYNGIRGFYDPACGVLSLEGRQLGFSTLVWREHRLVWTFIDLPGEIAPAF